MLPRNFSPSLRKKQKNWNGISVLLVPNGVKKMIHVMPQMQCFGATHVALHFALIAASAAWHATITSSIILQNFHQISCLTALVLKILPLMLEFLLMPFLLILHISDLLELSRPRHVRRTTKILFVTLRKVINAAIHIYKALLNTALKILTMADSSTA